MRMEMNGQWEITAQGRGRRMLGERVHLEEE